jgi:hopene-associated glycosyltransferase HpnB
MRHHSPVGSGGAPMYLEPMENTTMTALAAISLAIWLYLVFARGGFWRTAERLDDAPDGRGPWPDVVAIMPARNESEVIARSLGSLLAQDYPGRLDIIVVDDHSEDGTADQAEAAGRISDTHGLTVLRAAPLPPGWAGKVWAMSEGLRAVDATNPGARYIWLSDADIAHDTCNLRRLVSMAESGNRDLVSQMVVLSSEGFWAGLLIPAFVYFFQKLYPFAWVNDPRRRMAAAAGGCMLLRRGALDRIGGFSAIQSALIDDCALARAVKGEGGAADGGLYLGLTNAATSLRPYHGLGGIWRMVARSAYIQLDRSVLLLGATLAGMAITYLAPPAVFLSTPWHSGSLAALLSGAAWVLMTGSFLPTLRYYRRPLFLALLLPAAGLLYSAMTVDSAIAHWRGRGGAWKGRTQGTESEAGR